MVETELGGTPMPAGMPIYVVNQAASWDPSQYPDPMRFDIDRNPQRVPVFGGGVHFCIGNRLARLVLRTGLEALVTQFPRLRLADPARSEERRGGKECVSRFRSRWSPIH